MKKQHIHLCALALLSAAGSVVLTGCTEGQVISGTDLGNLVAAGASIVTDEKTATRLGNVTGKTWQGLRGFDIKEEIGIGQSVALAAFSRIGPLSQDTELLRYVNLVGLTCAETCDRPALPYKFAVVENDGMVNAFSAPGGYVFITTGALRLMKNEAELAGVLSHELGHITAKHALKMARAGKIGEAAVDLGAQTEKDKQKFMELVDLIVNGLLERGLSKGDEYQADRLGVEFAYNAGYDPRSMSAFLATLKSKEGSYDSGWFKTHPPLTSRITKINAQIRRDMPDAAGMAVLESRFQRRCLARLR